MPFWVSRFWVCGDLCRRLGLEAPGDLSGFISIYIYKHVCTYIYISLSLSLSAISGLYTDCHLGSDLSYLNCFPNVPHRLHSFEVAGRALNQLLVGQEWEEVGPSRRRQVPRPLGSPLRIMERKKETTIMGYIRYIILGLYWG